MEPLLLSQASPHREALNDLVVELASASAGLRRSLPGPIVSALADLVRSMNCYYSNLIEGHHTHPVDIERALRNDFGADPQRRNLQLEARAHVEAQQWIDAGGLNGRALEAEALVETHRRFCALLPEELLVVADPETGKIATVIPGAVPRFLERFEGTYAALGPSEMILASAAAHHRLLWIHPFLDGNGRVARLMSHAVLLELLNTGGLWSVARGLARSVSAY